MKCEDCGVEVGDKERCGYCGKILCAKHHHHGKAKMENCWVEGENYIYYNKRNLQITDITKNKKECDSHIGWIYLTKPLNMLEIRNILKDKEWNED